MSEVFKPASNGCGSKCSINKKEKEICCSTARQCCYFCFEENCPIKENYEIILE